MRYSHNLRIVRHPKHPTIISAIVTAILLVVVLYFGFTFLDAQDFFGGFGQSLFRVSISYFISLFLAVTLTLTITSSPKMENVLVPIFDVLQSFPSFALFPMLVVWFGKSTFVTILILTVTMIWPILFSLLSAQKQIRTDLLEAASIFGATGWKQLYYVQFPLLSPAIVTGSIVAWGEAWETIIAAEIIIGIGGVGTYLATAAASNSEIMAVGITLLLVLLFILNKYIWLPLLNGVTKYQQD